MKFYNFTKISNSSPLFNILERCRGVEQHPEWHPEGDVFNHSLQTLKCALRETDDIDLIVAAMLHDAGKQISKLGHEKYSVDLLKNHVSPKTLWLVGNHMRFWNYALGDMKKLSKVNELSGNEWFADLVKLCRWDKMGRKPDATPKYDRRLLIERLRDVNGESDKYNMYRV
jgi:exopolyphosphatase/pppGpp-phosphohydrolase